MLRLLKLRFRKASIRMRRVATVPFAQSSQAGSAFMTVLISWLNTISDGPIRQVKQATFGERVYAPLVYTRQLWINVRKVEPACQRIRGSG